MPKLLFIGDIVGKPGRDTVRAGVPALREQYTPDFVVANAENAAGGAGLTGQIAGELTDLGIDALTLGDHVWDQRNFAEEIVTLPSVCRPANLPPSNPGKPYLIVEKNGVKLGVFTVLGRTLMKLTADCPFRAADLVLAKLQKECDLIFAEVHAETTAEKVAFGWYLDGRAHAVIGTHTHIPTADNTILRRGTAYHTDAGMTGPYQSVLGREIDPIVAKFIDQMPRRWPVAEGDNRLCGTLVEFNGGVAVSCEQITWRME